MTSRPTLPDGDVNNRDWWRSLPLEQQNEYAVACAHAAMEALLANATGRGEDLVDVWEWASQSTVMTCQTLCFSVQHAFNAVGADLSTIRPDVALQFADLNDPANPHLAHPSQVPPDALAAGRLFTMFMNSELDDALAVWTSVPDTNRPTVFTLVIGLGMEIVRDGTARSVFLSECDIDENGRCRTHDSEVPE